MPHGLHPEDFGLVGMAVVLRCLLKTGKMLQRERVLSAGFCGALLFKLVLQC